MATKKKIGDSRVNRVVMKEGNCAKSLYYPKYVGWAS